MNSPHNINAMDITLDDLQVLTLLAQAPTRQDLASVKAELSTKAAKDVADVIVGQSSNDPVVQKTAQAIQDWVVRNRAFPRPSGRSESRERAQVARNWVGQNASAWEA